MLTKEEAKVLLAMLEELENMVHIENLDTETANHYASAKQKLTETAQ